MPAGKRSRNMRRFIFRRISILVKEIAEHLQRLESDGFVPEVPPGFEHIMTPVDDLDPDDPRTPYGHDEVASRIASLLLAEPVKRNQINKAKDGTGRKGTNLK